MVKYNACDVTVEFNNADDCKRYAHSDFMDTFCTFRSGKVAMFEVHDSSKFVSELFIALKQLEHHKLCTFNFDQYEVDGSIKYYIVVARYDNMDGYELEFGDYDKDACKEEMADIKYADKNQGVKAKYKVLTCKNERPKQIEKAIAKANAKLTK